MNIRTLFKFLLLTLIPLYIFMGPLVEYINKSDNITYIMNVPTKPNEYNDEINKINVEKIDVLNLPKIEKEIVESWVISYPKISDNKDIKIFLLKLKNIGIESFLFIKKKNKKVKIISIGPYVDRSMAISMKNKVNKLINYDGKIVRISN